MRDVAMVYVRRVVAGLVLAAVPACSSASNPPAATDPDSGAVAPDTGPDPVDAAVPLTWAPCDTKSWPDGYPTPVAGTECTTVQVPFDHADPGNGKTFTLRVARQKSKAFPSGKALFQLAGGPGGTSVGQTGLVPTYMPKLLDSFDFIYMDQRGTGGSGYLTCGAGYPQTESEWVTCGGEHTKEDLNHYLTKDAADDLDSVRAALGYGKIYVRGGSYGTRLGLEYLRQHGDNVVAMVLDGVDPPDSSFFGDFIVRADRGVKRLVSDCTASASCTAITSDLLGELTAYRARVKATPRSILVGSQPTVEDEPTFLDFLVGAMATAGSYFKIPRAIHAANGGNYALWDQIMSVLYGQTVSEPVGMSMKPPASGLDLRALMSRTHGIDYVAPGVYETVVCAENLPLTGGLSALQALNSSQAWGGDPGVLDIAGACSAWNVKPVDASLLQPVTSNAKVLLLNGSLDLNTFPEWGAHAAKTLPNATNLMVPYATHSTMSIPCVGDVLSQFIAQDGNMASVDASCINNIAEPAW